MYNHNIDAFLIVATCHSITQAAERLYISNTSVMHRINALEEALQVKLFDRSAKGSVLTPQGQYFYQQIPGLISLSESIVSNTRKADRNQNNIIRIGSTPLNETQYFNHIWQNSPKAKDFIVRMVSYPTDINATLPNSLTSPETADIGFAAECSMLNFVDTEFLPFDKYTLTVTVPLDHPLASRPKLKVSDLDGEVLLFPARGNPVLANDFALALTASNPGIKVETPPLFYDMELFNRCVMEHRILISLDCWDNMHPTLKNIPVDWDWAMRYGLIWKKNARKEVHDFIAAFKEGMEILRKTEEK